MSNDNDVQYNEGDETLSEGDQETAGSNDAVQWDTDDDTDDLWDDTPDTPAADPVLGIEARGQTTVQLHMALLTGGSAPYNVGPDGVKLYDAEFYLQGSTYVRDGRVLTPEDTIMPGDQLFGAKNHSNS